MKHYPWGPHRKGSLCRKYDYTVKSHVRKTSPTKHLRRLFRVIGGFTSTTARASGRIKNWIHNVHPDHLKIRSFITVHHSIHGK